MREGHKKWQEENPELVQANAKKLTDAKLKWQQSHPEEHQKQVNQWREKGTKANSKKVLCIETGEIFESASEAGRKKNTCQSNIGRSIKNGYSAGHDENFKKLHWKFL